MCTTIKSPHLRRTPCPGADLFQQHTRGRREQYASSHHLWNLVGGWTLASTDCARHGNGRDTGARYEGKYPGGVTVHPEAARRTWTGDGNAFTVASVRPSCVSFGKHTPQVSALFHRLLRGEADTSGSIGGGEWVDLLDVEG